MFITLKAPALDVTVIVKLHTVVLPIASVAVTVTVFTPKGNSVPEAGFETSELKIQLSDADGVKFTTAPQTPADEAATVILPGQVSTGGIVSITVTVCKQVFTFPETSTAVQVTEL